MRRRKRSVLFVLAVITAFFAAGFFMPGMVGAGDLEPTDRPGSTMKTLDEIPPTWSRILPASERFELVMGGAAVLDKETGLTWAKDANIFGGTQSWQGAINYCRNLNIGGRTGWRLPTVEDLSSLVDESEYNPALPAGHPFENVQSGFYWSSTAYEGSSDYAWHVHMSNGVVGYYNKDYDVLYVWPVRAGN